MLPVWLAVTQSLGAAILFAVGIQFLNLGHRHGDSRTGTLIDIGTTTFFYWLLSPIFLKQGHWTGTGFLIFAAVGLFGPLISANLALISVRRLGPTLTSTLTSTTPLFAAILGVLLLGETLTVFLIAGTLTVVPGTALPTLQRGSGTRSWPPLGFDVPLGGGRLALVCPCHDWYGFNLYPGTIVCRAGSLFSIVPHGTAGPGLAG